MKPQTEEQQAVFESVYAADISRWAFHDTKDPFVRYLRDRRILTALKSLRQLTALPLEKMSVLIVCGGVGREASFFANAGFSDVTNSDFSENALNVCEQRDCRLKTLQLNAEAISLSDAAYDLVVVQDGLHHLPRPVLGLNEMLRVARHAVIVLEPHSGIVAKLLGTEWERHEVAVNYVFRWNRALFFQVVLSQLLESKKQIKVIRLWDHGGMVSKIVTRLGKPTAFRLAAARLIYFLLSPFNWLGNNFIGIVVKGDAVKCKD